MEATWRRLSPLDRDVKRGKRQANVDRAADCIADHPSRPGVEDHRNIDKVIDDGDVRYVLNPDCWARRSPTLWFDSDRSADHDRCRSSRGDGAVGVAEDRVCASAAGSSCDLTIMPRCCSSARTCLQPYNSNSSQIAATASTMAVSSFTAVARSSARSRSACIPLPC